VGVEHLAGNRREPRMRLEGALFALDRFRSGSGPPFRPRPEYRACKQG
jgi:hypothetical protein